MITVFALATAAAMAGQPPVQGAVPDKPLTAYERLVRTCDLATTVWHFYGGTHDAVLRADLEMLRKSACDLPKDSK